MSENFPWKWLFFSIIWYFVMGLINAPFLAIGVLSATFAWSGAIAIAGHQVKRTMLTLVFLTGVAIVALALFIAVSSVSTTIAWIAVLSGFFMFIVATLLIGLVAACIGGWILAGIWVLTKAGNQLLQSFSKPYTFLIMSGTSWAGLALGWLVNLMILLKHLGIH